MSNATDTTIARFVRVPFTDDSTLVDIGLDSLSVVRIAVALLPDADQEIDPGALARLRTVGELRDWLAGTEATR